MWYHSCLHFEESSNIGKELERRGNKRSISDYSDNIIIKIG